MKVEQRGKYAGVKVHFEPEEVTRIIKGKGWKKLSRALDAAIKADPGILKKRSQKQIKRTLKKEVAKMQKQLDALASGKDWKQFSS